MKSNIIISLVLLCGLSLTACAQEKKVWKAEFQKNGNGGTVDIHDIAPELPKDWRQYNFMSLEYRVSSSQTMKVSLVTPSGKGTVKIGSYIPRAWSRISIPLRKFRSDHVYEGVDLMAASSEKGNLLAYVTSTSDHCPLEDVDSISFGIDLVKGQQSVEVRDITLSKTDPGDVYLENRPYVDEFGQNAFLDYPGKVKFLDDLKQQWAAEDALPDNPKAFNYSKYGGYLQKRVKGTGFFRTEKVGDRWWFVDPDGYLFLATGSCVEQIGNGGEIHHYDQRKYLFEKVPSDGFKAEMQPEARKVGANAFSFGFWNLYRRYGADFEEKGVNNLLRRMKRWGMNTIGMWSRDEVMAPHKVPFVRRFTNSGMQLSGKLLGLADIYEDGYKDRVENYIRREVSPWKDDPWLIGWFLGNEPAWVNHELTVCANIMKMRDTAPIKQVLTAWIEKYGNTDEAKRNFVYDIFDKEMAFLVQTLRKYDPNHLTLGVRFANLVRLPDKVYLSSTKHFDVVSFNLYTVCPDAKMFDRLKALVDKPLFIGEFHFMTCDRGYAMGTYTGVSNEQQRGVGYRLYVENGFAHPSLVGITWFAWSDGDMMGSKGGGANGNIGIVDVTDRPYRELTDAITETAKVLYDVHCGKRLPYNTRPY